MDKEFRRERALKGSNERWNPTIPKATHSGILNIGGQSLECDVLQDGRRILRHKTFSRAMGKSKPAGPDLKRAIELKLPVFISANNLTPYLEPIISERGEQIFYKSINGRKLIGYDATILPEACKIYVQAFNDGVLHKQQLPIAKICQTMLYGLATVGIVSLVDDCTGFVEQRNRDELQKILNKYISEELRAWTQKFPNELFKQIYRLYGWEYNASPKRPQCIGHIINKYVYEKLPPGVLEELKKKNPVNENGNRKYRFHQFLTEDLGNEHLQKQILQTVTLMKVSENIEHFNELVERL